MRVKRISTTENLLSILDYQNNERVRVIAAETLLLFALEKEVPTRNGNLLLMFLELSRVLFTS